MLLDDKKRLIKAEVITKGTISAAAISVRKIVDAAISNNATGVILAHNHPGGVAIPSPNDVAVTRKIYLALNSIDITLHDHIVVAGDDYVSLRESGNFADFDYM